MAHDQEPPPPFDPDPELIAHLEGNTRSLRGYRRKAEELRAGALAPIVDIDPSTVRAIAEQIQKLLEDIVTSSQILD